MIAMALVCRPELLIADEPTTALDVTIQAQILGLIRSLQREIGCSVLLITHDLGVVAQMADDVAVMYLGRIVEHGSVRDVLKRPRHPYTQGLLRSIPSLQSARRLASIPGTVPALSAIPPGCPFHPRCPPCPARALRRERPRRSCASWRRDTVQRACARRKFSWRATAMSERNPTAASPPPAGPLLSVRGLTKHFSIRSRGFFPKVVGTVRAIDDVTFDVQPGETLGLVGETGSGKTTVARCIMRALRPTAGEVLFRTAQGGVVDLATLGERPLKALRPQAQMIFQDPFSSLNPRMTVAQIVAEPLVVQGLARRAEIDQRVADILARVGLKPEHRTRYPARLLGRPAPAHRHRAGAHHAAVAGDRGRGDPRRSTCPCRRRCSTCSRTCSRSSGSRSFSWRTTWMSSGISATGWP